MVQNLDSLLGISTDSKVINEQQLDPCTVPDPLTVLIQIFLSVKDDQLVQQITIVYKLTAVIASACFHTTGRQEIGLVSAGDHHLSHRVAAEYSTGGRLGWQSAYLYTK